MTVTSWENAMGKPAPSLPSLEHMALASRNRLLHFENKARGGLKIKEKCAAIDRAIVEGDRLDRVVHWSDWFVNGMGKEILRSEDELRALNISSQTLRDKAAGARSEDESRRDRERRQKKNYQKTVREEIRRVVGCDPVARMRAKLDRWGLPGLPGRTAPRVVKALQSIKNWVPPRVCSAVLRSMWNGWCTKRRFQQSGGCLFGCGAFLGQDSIEHYAHCKITTSVLRRLLHYEGNIHKGQLMALGSNLAAQSDIDIIKFALWNYVIYSTHNHLRNLQGELEGDINILMEQVLREAVRGHNFASNFVDHCGNPDLHLLFNNVGLRKEEDEGNDFVHFEMDLFD